jgi:hypothetical protein
MPSWDAFIKKKSALCAGLLSSGCLQGERRERGTARPENMGERGRFTTQATARRREVADLLRAARELLNEGMRRLDHMAIAGH